MNRSQQLRIISVGALFALSLAMAPVAAIAQGKESHETHQNKDGSWTQTDVSKDGSKKETQMDKDHHKTKETDYDTDGTKYKETDWGWDAKEKVDVRRKEHFFAPDGEENLTKEYDENGVLIRVVGWIDGIEIVDTYSGGKWVRRDKKKGGKVIKTETPSSRAADTQKMLLPPPPPPTFSQGVSFSGVVVAVPDRFAQGEAIAFKIVKITGEVVANEPVRLANSQGETIESRTDTAGAVAVTIPGHWIDARIEVLGAAVMTYAATHTGSGRGPALSNPPKIIQAGNVITLHGDGFTPDLAGNTVSLGDQNGLVLGATRNALTVLVPSGAKPGATQMRVTTAGQSTAPVMVTAIDVAFDPGPSTLVAGQRITRTLRIIGTEQKLPVQIEDPAGDAATISNAGQRTSSGGRNNTVSVKLTGTNQGAYSVTAGIDWKRVADVLTEPSPSGRAEAAGRKAGAAAHEANLANYFAQGEDAQMWQNAATEWRRAAKSWRDAQHAWEDGDEARATAAETDAKMHETAARKAIH